MLLVPPPPLTLPLMVEPAYSPSVSSPAPKIRLPCTLAPTSLTKTTSPLPLLPMTLLVVPLPASMTPLVVDRIGCSCRLVLEPDGGRVAGGDQPLFRIVLPPPMTWMATPVVSVPNAWTFASFEIVRVPPLLNSIVAASRPSSGDLRVRQGIVAHHRAFLEQDDRVVPRLMACVLPTVSWAPGCSVTDWLAGLPAPWPPILSVDGLGALVSQMVVTPVVTQAA